MITVHQTEHTSTRIDIVTGLAFDDFVAAFEAAAPPFDPAPVERVRAAGGTWDDVRAAVVRNAPNELMVYARIDATPLLAVAGHRIRAIEYLVGNHVIAETMFRHDPKALLYAPLRMLVFSDSDGDAVFTMDRPSAAFSSLGIPEVTEVGKALDQKVVNLLGLAGVDLGSAAQQAFD